MLRNSMMVLLLVLASSVSESQNLTIHGLSTNGSLDHYGFQHFTKSGSTSMCGLAFSPIQGGEKDRKLALSFNPLGFIQFGPILNFEYGLKSHIALNGHLRFSPLGALSYAIRSADGGVDELSGIAFGGGLIYFTGENRSKAYVGMLLEYEKSTAIYLQGDSWEWTEKEKIFVFTFNGGYRFLFSSGFFVNTGAYLGVYRSKWNWYYTDSSNGYGNSGSDIKPFGMLELTFGLSF